MILDITCFIFFFLGSSNFLFLVFMRSLIFFSLSFLIPIFRYSSAALMSLCKTLFAVLCDLHALFIFLISASLCIVPSTFLRFLSAALTLPRFSPHVDLTRAILIALRLEAILWSFVVYFFLFSIGLGYVLVSSLSIVPLAAPIIHCMMSSALLDSGLVVASILFSSIITPSFSTPMSSMSRVHLVIVCGSHIAVEFSATPATFIGKSAMTIRWSAPFSCMSALCMATRVSGCSAAWFVANILSSNLFVCVALLVTALRFGNAVLNTSLSFMSSIFWITYASGSN